MGVPRLAGRVFDSIFCSSFFCRVPAASVPCGQGLCASMLAYPRSWDESPLNGFMLLSSASATPDAPNASADATTSCLLSEKFVRDMVDSFKVCTAVKKMPLVRFSKLYIDRAIGTRGETPMPAGMRLQMAFAALHQDLEPPRHQ